MIAIFKKNYGSNLHNYIKLYIVLNDDDVPATRFTDSDNRDI